LGLEQFSFAHERGSSHGETRIIRKAYFEHPNYVPLLNESYELWGDLERRTRSKIFDQCGLFYALRPDGEILEGLKQSSRLHGIRVEEGRDVCRHPFSLDSNLVQLFEPEAGLLRVDAALKVFHDEAVQNGGSLHFEETLLGFEKDKSGFFKIKTTRDEYLSRKIIFSAGGWNKRLFEQFGVSLPLVRKVLVWAEAPSSMALESGASCFFLESTQGIFYGFPSIDSQNGKGSFKFAEHDHTQDDILKDAGDLLLGKNDLSRHEDFLKSALPKHELSILRSKPCLYTMTRDSHFVLDFHPHDKDILLCSPCSGHGFKFAPVIGRLVCDMVKEGRVDPLAAFMNLGRLLETGLKQS
jgi:sarcosine oxidase